MNRSATADEGNSHAPDREAPGVCNSVRDDRSTRLRSRCHNGSSSPTLGLAISRSPFGYWPRIALASWSSSEPIAATHAAFCQAVTELDLDTACYAVDTWVGDPQAGFYGEEIYEELRQYHDPRYSAFSRLVRSTFDEALEHFADDLIDLLHIDGCHTYEAVKGDFESWLPKLSSRGVVLIHDVNVRERDFGAWRLWQEVSLAAPISRSCIAMASACSVSGRTRPRRWANRSPAACATTGYGDHQASLRGQCPRRSIDAPGRQPALGCRCCHNAAEGGRGSGAGCHR